MDSARDFEGCLKSLEACEDQAVDLGSEITKVIADGEKVLCGLQNGEVCLLHMGKTVSKLQSAAARKAVTSLAWVAGDQCVSAHADGACIQWDWRQCAEVAVLDVKDAGEDGKKDHAKSSGRREDARHDPLDIRKTREKPARKQQQNPESECYESLVVTSDGKLVCGSTLGNLKILDLKQGKVLAKIAAHTEAISSLCLKNAAMCFTGSTDLTVKLWSLEDFQELSSLAKGSSSVSCLELAGEYLFAVHGNKIKVWDLGSDDEVGRYSGHASPVKYLKRLGCNRCISCDSEKVQEWSLDDFTGTRSYAIPGICFELQSRRLFIGTESGLSVVDLQTFQLTTEVKIASGVSSVHYFEGKCACISGSFVMTVEVEQYQQMYELSAQEYAVAGVLPCDSDRLVSWSDDKSLRVLSVSKHCELAVMAGHSSKINCAAVTSDGKCLSGSNDSYLKVWDLSNMKEVQTDMKHGRPVSCVAVTSKGKAVSGDIEGGMFVWSLIDYTQIGELKGHTACVFCVAVASDEVAITGSWDCSVRVWNLAACSLQVTLEGHQEKIWHISLAAGNRCLSASADRTLKVWDLGKGSLIATLDGHADEVLTAAVSGEKCVSGSTDKAIIIWDLIHYQQEAKFVCSAEVLRIVFVSESQFVSGHRSGEVKVWESGRELTSLRGHTKRVWGLCSLEGCQLASASHDGTVKVWHLGRLSNCLLRCADHAEIEREASQRKSVETQLRQQIPDFKAGSGIFQCKNFYPYFFNALHFCAHYNHPEAMQKYLAAGVALLRGVFGSPLTIALERNTIECVDAVLDYLGSIAPSSDAWKSFETVNDDLLPLLGCGSSRLEAFFAAVLQPPPQALPAFITAVLPLPLVQFAGRPSVREFEYFSPGTRGEELVKFCVSLAQLGFAAGSTESIEFLAAAVSCEEKRVLLTDYFRTVIEEKWSRCFLFTLSMSATYGAMLACLLGAIDSGSEQLCIGYLALNGLIALYELAQLFAMRLNYITEGWNVLDCVRCSLGIAWGSLVLKGYAIAQYFTLLVVVLDFARGFTHFRTFRRTRIFVYMTFSVVAEVFSFLVILAYSVFAFGIFTGVLVGEKSLAETWKRAYNVTMSNFDTQHYGSLEWVVFTGATVTNIVVMMNLLISILGEAYEKAQMTVLENDLHMQASLILEYETLMVWRRQAGERTWVITCRKADRGAGQLEWSGKVLQIINSVRSDLTRAQGEITADIAELRTAVSAGTEGIEGIKAKVAIIDDIKTQMKGIKDISARFEGIDVLQDSMSSVSRNVETISSDVDDIKEGVSALNEVFEENTATVMEKVTAIGEKVAGIEEKIAGIDEKLDAFLGFLQARS